MRSWPWVWPWQSCCTWQADIRQNQRIFLSSLSVRLSAKSQTEDHHHRKTVNTGSGYNGKERERERKRERERDRKTDRDRKRKRSGGELLEKKERAVARFDEWSNKQKGRE